MPMKLPHAALLKMLKAKAAAASMSRLSSDGGNELSPNLFADLPGMGLPNALAGMNGGMAGQSVMGKGMGTSIISMEEKVTMNTCFENNTLKLQKD